MQSLFRYNLLIVLQPAVILIAVCFVLFPSVSWFIVFSCVVIVYIMHFILNILHLCIVFITLFLPFYHVHEIFVLLCIVVLCINLHIIIVSSFALWFTIFVLCIVRSLVIILYILYSVFFCPGPSDIVIFYIVLVDILRYDTYITPMSCVFHFSCFVLHILVVFANIL